MIRAKNGLPRYCCWAVDRHGKKRVRFRKAGFSAYLKGIPWSPEFMRHYGAALDGLKVQGEIGVDRTTPGTFNALAVAYYRSPEFRSLKASTVTTRRGIIERFRAEHGDKPVKLLTRAHIKAIMAAKADTPEAANNLLKVLRMLALAVDMGMIAHNPATGIKKFKSRSDGFHTWTDEEVRTFEARHPIGSKARLALALLLYTAQRRSDVVRLGRQHLQLPTLHKKLIAVRQEKTGQPLLIPVHPELDRALAAVPADHLTFLTTAHGAPFTAAGFGNWFRDRCNEAGLPQCSAHGLRKAAATRLATPDAPPTRYGRSPAIGRFRRLPATRRQPIRSGSPVRRCTCWGAQTKNRNCPTWKTGWTKLAVSD